MVFVFIFGLMGVAFITLIERKILRLRQLRLGPNKITILGIAQPVVDGIKLLFKEIIVPTVSQGVVYSVFPLALLCFFLTI